MALFGKLFAKKDKPTLEPGKLQRQMEKCTENLLNRSALIKLTGCTKKPVQLLHLMRGSAGLVPGKSKFTKRGEQVSDRAFR